MRYIRSLIGAFFVLTFSVSPLRAADSDMPGPKVGDKAADFTLKTIAGEEVSLAKSYAKNPVVLVVLRGWPGYQCPICTRQVSELLSQQEALKSHGAQVLLVYPGPAKQLTDHAKEFVNGKNLPEHFAFVTDPDYTMVNAWQLRWDAPKETAYPSTFVIDRRGVIRFVTVSKSHGGRAKTADVLTALEKLGK